MEGYQQTSHGLIRKRAELAADIQRLQQEIANRVADLRAIETAIRIFDPNVDYEDLPVRRIPPAYAAFRGEMARAILGFLRDAPKGLTTHEVTSMLMAHRHLDANDPRAFKLINKRTGHSLTGLRTKGYIMSQKDNARGMQRWCLAGALAVREGDWRNGSGIHN
jgi:hypothetical protein